MTSEDLRLLFEGALAVFALAGFVLSLVGLWYTWWSNRPRVRVKMRLAFIPGRAAGTAMFMIEAYNEGRAPVALTSVGVDVRNHGEPKSTAVFMSPPFFDAPLPHVLQPGRRWVYHVEPAEIVAVHRSPEGPVLGPFVDDEGGHHWSSRSKRSWLDSWAKKPS